MRALFLVAVVTALAEVALAAEQPATLPAKEEEVDEWQANGGRAEPDTVLKDPVQGDAYGLVGVMPSKIGDERATYLHFRGGWMPRREWGFGLDVVGLASDFQAPVQGNVDTKLQMFGFALEYSPFADSKVHPNLVLTAGEGRIQYDDRDQHKIIKKDYFSYVSPELNMEINLTSYARLLLGVTYHAVKGVSIVGLDNEMVSNGAIHLGVKLGKF